MERGHLYGGPQGIPLGEPVTRSDSEVVALYKTDEGIALDVGSITAHYTDDEVKFLGEGDWGKGFMRIAQAGVAAEESMLVSGKHFQADLDVAKQSGLL